MTTAKRKLVARSALVYCACFRYIKKEPTTTTRNLSIRSVDDNFVVGECMCECVCARTYSTHVPKHVARLHYVPEILFPFSSILHTLFVHQPIKHIYRCKLVSTFIYSRTYTFCCFFFFFFLITYYIIYAEQCSMSVWLM